MSGADAEGGEVNSLDRLVELAADAGGEEVLVDRVAVVDPRHDVAREGEVELGVGLGAGRAGEA